MTLRPLVRLCPLALTRFPLSILRRLAFDGGVEGMALRPLVRLCPPHSRLSLLFSCFVG